MTARTRIHIALFAIAAYTVFFLPPHAFGETASEIRQEIREHNAQIEELNKEIAAFEKELSEVGKQKQTLQSTLSQIDLSRKKLSASISVTKNKIGTIQLELQNLSRDIASTEDLIQINESGLGETIRRLNEAEARSLALTLLSTDGFASLWNDMDETRRIQGAMKTDLERLSVEKRSLADTKDATEKKQAELLVQQRNLVAQQGALDATRRAQADLLAQTKSQESSYQALLLEKQAAKTSFEQALEGLESKLEFVLDPSRVPPVGKGILRWPVDNVFITQEFGKTSSSGRLYASGTHNGVDFRASIDTPIKAALGGTVISTGNTDGGGCWSYGKWVLVKHGNGLTTLYAHLSNISVSSGETVATGQIIGFSGFTGYATGPHLHFTVFASDGVQVKNLGSWYKENGLPATTACAKKGAIIPVAAQSAYLNPFDYL